MAENAAHGGSGSREPIGVLARHRRRERLALYSALLPPVAFGLSGEKQWVFAISLIVPFGLFVNACLKAQKLVCPRCGELFFWHKGGWGNLAAKRCLSCGLSVFAREVDPPGQGEKPRSGGDS